MSDPKPKFDRTRAVHALKRVKILLDDEPDRMPMGEIVGRIKNGSMCVIKTERLERLLDAYDKLEASLVDEQTNTGKQIEQALFDIPRETYD